MFCYLVRIFYEARCARREKCAEIGHGWLISLSPTVSVGPRCAHTVCRLVREFHDIACGSEPHASADLLRREHFFRIHDPMRIKRGFDASHQSDLLG